MVIAQVYVDGVTAKVTDLQPIPKGIQGATIEVKYGSAWASLQKTAVFSGTTVKDVVNPGAVITIPPETVAKSGHRLRVGFYGVDGENKVIMPTLWVDLGAIQSAADPSGDTSTNSSLPVWAQLQAEFEALKEAGGIKGEKGDKGDPGPQGPQGVQGIQGDPGQPGADYILTEADKSEIAGMAAELVEVPEVSMKPLTFTGAVNATYDGSEAVSVEIPQGGGGSGGTSFNPVLLAELKGDGVAAEHTTSFELVKPGIYFISFTVNGADAETTGNVLYVRFGGAGIFGSGYRSASITTVNNQYQNFRSYITLMVDSNNWIGTIGDATSGSNYSNGDGFTMSNPVGKFSLYSQSSKPVPTNASAKLWRLA